jgi:hypothetical protein
VLGLFELKMLMLRVSKFKASSSQTTAKKTKSSFIVTKNNRRFSTNLSEEDKAKLNSPRAQDEVDLLIVGNTL